MSDVVKDQIVEQPQAPPKERPNRNRCGRCQLEAIAPIVVKAGNSTRCTNIGACERRQRRIPRSKPATDGKR